MLESQIDDKNEEFGYHLESFPFNSEAYYAWSLEIEEEIVRVFGKDIEVHRHSDGNHFVLKDGSIYDVHFDEKGGIFLAFPRIINPKIDQKLVDPIENLSESRFSTGFQKAKVEIISLNFLLYIAAFTCKSDEREVILGDLEEKYAKYEIKFGKTRAKSIIAWDVFVSIYPMLKNFARSKTISILKKFGLYIVWKYFWG